MAFDRLGGRREAVAGKEAGQQPVHRGFARMEGLAHRAVDDLHPRRLGGTGAERRQRQLRRQAEQPRGRDRGPDVPDRAGHVPADVVVSGSGSDRDAGLHLEACDKRCDGELAGDGYQLARRGDSRPQRSAAVDGGPIGVEGVVEVQHVCGDAVG